MRSATEIWEAALGELELQVNKPNFRTWLAKTVGLSRQENRFVVGVPNTFVAEYLDKNQRSLIEKTLIGLTHSDLEVDFQIMSAHQEAYRPAQTDLPSLNPRYTFDSFIVGSCNRLAHAAALSAAQNPGHSYNPLFIYGVVGLGKTHILLAIGHMARASHLNVLYVSGEQFTNDFVSALREKQTEAFRNRYRSVDLLLIDDIQFIGGKVQTEECFFHTFNELHQANHQIVITGDCPPKTMPLMEARLRSRFEWGLTVEIQPPDLKTRLAILEAKAEQAGAEVTPAVLEYIAGQIKKSIRELEGSLNRVVAYARLLRVAITPELAQQALKDITRPAAPGSPTGPELLVEAIAESFQLSPEDLIGRRRDKETALARQVAMYLMKQQNNYSLAEIGRQLGGRTPATVGHACGKIAQDMKNCSHLRHKITDIKERVYPKAEVNNL